jgi:membrane protease YdiL (CAAX protease family)
VAGRDATKVLQSVKGILDLPARLVEALLKLSACGGWESPAWFASTPQSGDGIMTESADTIGPAAASSFEKPRPRPWGVIASIIWVVLAFEVFGSAIDYLFTSPPLQALGHDSAIGHAVELFAAWAVQLLVIVVAVLLARWPVAEYLGWVRPRAKDLAFGIAVVLAWSLAGNGIAYLVTGHAFNIAGYRAAVAAGTSPWWYVLRWWPAIFCAPIVEESAIRGFMWRGIEYRAGRLAAFLVTSFCFTAMHYRYFLGLNGNNNLVFSDITFGSYVISGLIYGWLRWRGGNTTVTIVPHFVENLYVSLSDVIAAALIG